MLAKTMISIAADSGEVQIILRSEGPP